jgi:hypothetical protein
MHPARGSDRRRTVWPPGEVQQVTSLFLDLVDEAAPGLVEGLYLHGSLGFGEWYAGRSDIDFVAVTGRRPDDSTTRLLRDLHARVGDTFTGIPFDGIHVTWGDLSRTPYDCPDVPCVQAGDWQDRGRLGVDPVTWHELARHGVRVRGPELEEVDVWTDPAELAAYSHANLSTYWLPKLAGLHQSPDEAARPEAVAWFVLGPARLHHLLVTGRLTSKNGAGRHLLDAFGDRWLPVVTEALAHRATGEPTGAYDGAPDRLAAEVLELATAVVADGLTRAP